MNRKAIRSLLVAMTVMAIACIAAPRTASAQPIAWCPSGCYTVDLTGLPTTCFPLCTYTSWGGGTLIWPSTSSPCYATPGVYTECPVPAQPIGTPLDWVDVGGVVIPGVVGQGTAGNSASCSLCAVLCTNSALCLYIKVYPGPCPVAPLPCP